VGSKLDTRLGFDLLNGISVGTKYWPSIANSSVIGLLVFLAMASALFAVGRKKLE
jgi:hypothetical protein